ASLLLLEGIFVAENIMQPNPAVNFTLYGGLQIQEEGYTSTSYSGFHLFPEYDERLFNQCPPWYPQYEMSGIETADTPLSGLVLSASCNPFFSTVALIMSEPGTISVFDSTGRIVGSCDTEGDWDWDGSSLPQGVYVFVAEGVSGESSSLKLVKL
ncbi:MAG: T9SS type A sorting domain-containing protein, partial [Candidatus Fermentibacteria bacterium]|nr:T9SS type A sorting domain-containing protein [Candidatus Fermentibacteria bacterium]